MRFARRWSRPRGLAESAPRNGRFRLAVDRSFTLSGAGTIVTGTVMSGAVAVGDRVDGEPFGAFGARALDPCAEPAAERGQAGERCALNLAGEASARSDRARRHRARSGTARSDRRASMQACACSPSEARPLAHWTPVRLHHAAVDVGARVALLEDDSDRPGARGARATRAGRPIAAAVGDRFVLRDTIGAAHDRRRHISRSARRRTPAPYGGAACAARCPRARRPGTRAGRAARVSAWLCRH